MRTVPRIYWDFRQPQLFSTVCRWSSCFLTMNSEKNIYKIKTTRWLLNTWETETWEQWKSKDLLCRDGCSIIETKVSTHFANLSIALFTLILLYHYWCVRRRCTKSNFCIIALKKPKKPSKHYIFKYVLTLNATLQFLSLLMTNYFWVRVNILELTKNETLTCLAQRGASPFLSQM